MTQVTISKKQENKAMSAVIAMTSELSQVVKQFQGIESKKLPDTDGLTVESYLDARGMYRPVKNGKKGKYSPTSVFHAWHPDMKFKMQDGTHCSIYKQVVGKIMVDEPGSPNPVAYRVFTAEQAQKLDGKCISLYKQVEIPFQKWSVKTILQGLKQGANFEKENEKALKSELEWAEVDKVYIVKMIGAGESITRKVIEVNKSDVVF